MTLSLDGRPVRAACGTAVAPAHGLADAPPLDAVFVVSDTPLPEAARDGHGALHGWLRERASSTTLMGGIGTGAAVLAQAGLLSGHRATLHWAHGPQLADAHASVVVSSNVYEIDRARLTEAVSLMEANLGEPLPTEDIARLVGVSRRQLERLFKQHRDELPSRYYGELRLSRARRLLQQTSQSILQVGLGCGFSSGSHFSNAYRARYGHTPREERSQRASAWREQTSTAPPQDTAAAAQPREVNA